MKKQAENVENQFLTEEVDDLGLVFLDDDDEDVFADDRSVTAVEPRATAEAETEPEPDAEPAAAAITEPVTDAEYAAEAETAAETVMEVKRVRKADASRRGGAAKGNPNAARPAAHRGERRTEHHAETLAEHHAAHRAERDAEPHTEHRADRSVRTAARHGAVQGARGTRHPAKRRAGKSGLLAGIALPAAAALLVLLIAVAGVFAVRVRARRTALEAFSGIGTDFEAAKAISDSRIEAIRQAQNGQPGETAADQPEDAEDQAEAEDGQTESEKENGQAVAGNI